jgi:branched-chain amino acid transport system ATP-binding protein
METILRLHDVSKSFGMLSAVKDVSFEVEKGEIFGIAGPNGAGKTTLFNVISGIPFPADSGSIIFKGAPIQKRAPYKIYQHGLARTFQRETVFGSLSVLENVTIAARYGAGTRGKDPRRISMDTLEVVGLEGKSSTLAGELSLFEKKLLMLASALVSQPALLMLDEPASGLNRNEIAHFAKIVTLLKANGMTLLLIEHVLPLLLTLSDRLMILDHGRKLTEGHPDDVLKEPAVVRAYLGKGFRHAG